MHEGCKKEGRKEGSKEGRKQGRKKRRQKVREERPDFFQKKVLKRMKKDIHVYRN